MKKFAKLMVLALVVAAIAAIFAIPSSAATTTVTGPVLYISNTGAGTKDGSSAANAMGHGEGYVPDDVACYKQNVMIMALKELMPTGGTIVLVGPTSLDTASSNTNVSGKTAAELDVPSATGFATSDPDYNVRPTIMVTSVYGGTDYRTEANGGAKLILDHAECCSSNIRLKSPGIWKDLNIEYRYDPNWTSYYNNTPEGIVAPYMFECDHTRQVFDTGITCTSVKVTTAADGSQTEEPGDVYPMILGGHRQATRTGMGTDVTVKSGTWYAVIAGGHGHNSGDGKTGTVDGNAKVTIEGGKIEHVYGTGSLSRAYGTVVGTVDITVTGGEIGDVYLTNGEVYTGPGITFTANNATIGAIYHSPIEGELLPECTVTVNGQPYTPPASETPATDAPATDAPAGDAPATNAPSASKPATQKPASTTAPVVDDGEEGGDMTMIIIIVVVAVVVIAAAVVVAILISKKKKAAK